MPGAEVARQIWGFAVPQEAFRYRFLMHTVLAFGSNHLAHINTTQAQHYRMLGSTHQTAAIAGLNKEISAADITAENCHALFASASMIVVNAFADPEDYSLDALVDVIKLCRGIQHILTSTESIILKGPFAIMLRPQPDLPKPLPLLSNFLVDLVALAAASQYKYSDSISNPAEVLRCALQHGIETSTYPALRAVMLWPMRIETEHLEALRARTDPDIVTVFRQYCRILEYAGDWWFLAGWKNVSQQFLLHSQ